MQFHPVLEPDPRDELAADAALSDADLARDRPPPGALDGASTSGHGRLRRSRSSQSARRSGDADLAAALGRERAAFKLDVRKLKASG